MIRMKGALVSLIFALSATSGRSGPAVSPTATASPSPTPGAVIFVDASVPASGDGMSWAGAKRTIGEGVALGAGQNGQVWVAAGGYLETVTIPPPGFVSVYGGFTGLNGSMETDLSQRDPAANPTVLDGGGTIGPMVTMDSVHFVRIDGLTITGGIARFGGGVYCSFSDAIHIVNCRITDNRAENTEAGGSIAEMPDTYHERTGGGIYTRYSDVMVEHCEIANNFASRDGGGMYSVGGNVIVLDSVLEENSSEHLSPGINFEETTSAGPGLGLLHCTSARIERSIFRNNLAAIPDLPVSPLLVGVAVGGFDVSSAEIINCQFSGNRLEDGAGYVVGLGVAGFFSFSGASGGMRADIVNCTFSGNSIPFSSYSVFMDMPVAGAVAGGYVNEGLPIDLQVSNTVILESGLFAVSMSNFDDTTPVGPVLNNCLLESGPDGDVLLQADLLNQFSRVILDGATEINSMLPGASGNLDGDPMFYDGEAGDFRLLAGSPAIDAGRGGPDIPLVDLAGLPRPVDIPFTGADGTGTEFDIGAHERQDPAPTPPVTRTPTATPSPTVAPSATPVASPTSSPAPCCPGDADNSGGPVNANDFLAVQAAFGADNGPGGLGDADCSGGAVNANDFLAVQAAFGVNCG